MIWHQFPEELRRFLILFIAGKEKNYSSQVERRAFSIRADMCRAATNGEWKLTKHILLTVTLRHLFRGKEVSNIIYKYTCIREITFAI